MAIFGFGGDKTLEFSVDEISTMKKKVGTIKEDLKKAKETLKTDIESLTADWNTPAGKKFIEETDTDWGPKVDSYILVLTTLESILEEAKNHYQVVEDKIKTINF